MANLRLAMELSYGTSFSWNFKPYLMLAMKVRRHFKVIEVKLTIIYKHWHLSTFGEFVVANGKILIL